MLTQTRLKELLTYDPATGLFRWRMNRSGGAKIGRLAQHIEATGYVVIRIEGKRYKAHRLAFLYMTGEFPTDMVDHINGDRADNRWQNLRPATRSQNNTNRPVSARCRLGVKGVSLSRGRYRADIRVNGKAINLGRFDTICEASAAYAKAANDLHGDFVRVA